MKQLHLNSYLKIISLCIFLTTNAAAQAVAQLKDQTMKTGPIYFVQNKNMDAMLYINVRQGGDDYNYSLILYDLQKAQIVQQKEIGVAKDANTDRLIGKMGDVFWVFTDSLMGYDVFTLAPVVTPSIIVAKYAFMQNNFSSFPNNYLMDEAAQVLYISPENGERFKLYPDLSMKPDNTSSDLPGDENFSYEYAAEYKVNNKYELKYALNNVDTFHNQLYILVNENETSNVLSYFGTSINTGDEEMRKLTIIAYNSNGDKIDYSTNKPVTLTNQYFRGSFLQNKFFTTTWHGVAGERLILHERDKKLFAAFTGKDGNEKWNINTQQFFNNFIDYIITDKYFIAWFMTKGGETFIAINLQSGALL